MNFCGDGMKKGSQTHRLSHSRECSRESELAFRGAMKK